MKQISIALFFLLLAFAAWGQGSSCQELLKMEKEFSRKLPMTVDEVTTLVELSVNCETKIVKYVKHLSVDGTTLAKGFAERKQRQYLNLHCNKNGLATHGWTATDYVYDKNMDLLMKLVATPQNCNQRDDS